MTRSLTRSLTRSSHPGSKHLLGTAVVAAIAAMWAILALSLVGGETTITAGSGFDIAATNGGAVAGPQSTAVGLPPVVAIDTGGEAPELWTEAELIEWLEQWLEERFGDDGIPVPNPPTPTTITTTTTAPTTTTPTTAPTTTTPTTAPTITTTTTAPTTTTQPDPGSDNLFRLTVGSGNSTDFDNSSAPGAVSAHGTRIYCVTSHFSYDDPVVFPGRPGAAHSHMFWGNTGADAFSTGDSLMTSGNSSCEGGTTNRSSYWMPTLFNSAGEATVPESIFVYYKSFGSPRFDRSTIQPIPAGLEMLASRDVRGASNAHLRIQQSGSGTDVRVSFPECVAVDGNGRPILTSDDNVSHLSYATDASAASGCPASHPYRMPTVSYIVRFAVPYESGWYLASDHGTGDKGHSLHADYIAAWDAGTMDELVECTIVARRSCEFPGRGQLPERFFTPSGEKIYRYSVMLEPDADRTPFGTQIRKSR